MIRLLVETHVPSAVVQHLQRQGIDAVALQHWRGGDYRTATDEVILAAASTEQRIIVTYDRKTFPPLLVTWAQAGMHHAGVVLISRKTIAPTDVGGLLRALTQLFDRYGDEGWVNRVVYLSVEPP